MTYLQNKSLELHFILQNYASSSYDG